MSPDALMTDLMTGWVSDGLRLWTAADTRLVTEYRNRVLSAFNEGREHQLPEIFAEIRDDEAFTAALWASLPNPCKTFLRNTVR